MVGLIDVIDCEDTALDRIKVAICQMKVNPNTIGIYGKSISHQALTAIRGRMRRFLDEIKSETPNLIIFPECSIPFQLLEELEVYANEHDCIVIAGSHYKDTGKNFVSRAPVIIPGTATYYVEKTTLSPLKKSGAKRKYIEPGQQQYFFSNTKVGNFMVLICADFLHAEALQQIHALQPDLVLVPAFHSKSPAHYFPIFSSACRESDDGLYGIYCNAFYPNAADGNSSIFANIDRIYHHDFREEGYSDLQPPEKLWVANEANDFLVVELDLAHKKPSLPKGTGASPNVRIIAGRKHGQIKEGPYQYHRHYKLVAFDADGTLLRGTKFSWQDLWRALGDVDLENWREAYQQHDEQKITYEEWCKRAVGFFRLGGLSKAEIQAAAKRRARLTANFEEGLARLKAEGFVVAMISGGVDEYVKAHIPSYKILFDDYFINELLFDGDDVVRDVIVTDFDYSGKAKALEMLCDKYSFDMQEVIFVGDTLNDAHALRQAGYSIIYRDTENDTAYSAKKIILEDNMNTLVDHILEITAKD